MKEFSEYFSTDSIIKELCRARIKLAKKRNEALFIHRISRDKPSAEEKSRAAKEDLEGLFPSRRLWIKFRARSERRKNKDSQSINQDSLERAVKILMLRQASSHWVKNLKTRVARIRERALNSMDFSFESPIVLAAEKNPKLHQFRPLAIYKTDDKIIECITARYLRQKLYFVFFPSSLAFRCRQDNQKSPVTTHTALERLAEFRNRYSTLFVAEADIQAFFDCVSHKVAASALLKLIESGKKLKPDLEVSKRSIKIFRAYLKSYNFRDQVWGQGLSEMRKRNASATFPWPEKTLQKLHGRKRLPAIGVPQGGAISCFIANLILHQADVAIDQLRRKRKRALSYMRYCDDMIIASPNRSLCKAAMSVYETTLTHIKLPLHKPEPVGIYGTVPKIHFWKQKSKQPYPWSSVSDGGIPWIQFVGYQIRYDGLVRIRQKSLKKHINKLTTATNEMLRAINPGRKLRKGIPIYANGLRKNHQEIQHRFKMKLLSLAVGRRQLGHVLPKDGEEIMPMCWAKGFRGLSGRSFVSSHLKVLDRHRERQLRRVRIRLRHLTKAEEISRSKSGQKHIAYYGHPFSYYGQFTSIKN